VYNLERFYHARREFIKEICAISGWRISIKFDIIIAISSNVLMRRRAGGGSAGKCLLQ